VDRRFLNAHIDPAPFRLLGRTLYPWCLKYRVRLHAFDSPLVTGSRGITPADLLFACQVCAEEPLGHVGLIDRLRLSRLNDNPAKFEMLLNAFAGYILVDDWPKFWEQDQKKSGGNKGLPWPMSIVAKVFRIGVQTADQRAHQAPVPLHVVVDGLPQLVVHALQVGRVNVQHGYPHRLLVNGATAPRAA
jgi:hypothetical protein